MVKFKFIFIIDITIIIDGFEIDKQMKNGVLCETLSNNTIQIVGQKNKVNRNFLFSYVFRVILQVYLMLLLCPSKNNVALNIIIRLVIDHY